MFGAKAEILEQRKDNPFIAAGIRRYMEDVAVICNCSYYAWNVMTGGNAERVVIPGITRDETTGKEQEYTLTRVRGMNFPHPDSMERVPHLMQIPARDIALDATGALTDANKLRFGCSLIDGEKPTAQELQALKDNFRNHLETTIERGKQLWRERETNPENLRLLSGSNNEFKRAARWLHADVPYMRDAQHENTVPCPKCSTFISRVATTCPQCGAVEIEGEWRNKYEAEAFFANTVFAKEEKKK